MIVLFSKISFTWIILVLLNFFYNVSLGVAVNSWDFFQMSPRGCSYLKVVIRKMIRNSKCMGFVNLEFLMLNDMALQVV